MYIYHTIFHHQFAQYVVMKDGAFCLIDKWQINTIYAGTRFHKNSATKCQNGRLLFLAGTFNYKFEMGPFVPFFLLQFLFLVDMIQSDFFISNVHCVYFDTFSLILCIFMINCFTCKNVEFSWFVILVVTVQVNKCFNCVHVYIFF